MIFQTEMKSGNQKDSSDESRGTPFGARSSNRALLFAGNVRFQQRMQASSTVSAAAELGALTQDATTYSSNSTSSADLNQVNQTLSGGSSGSVGTPRRTVRQPRRTPRSATRPTHWRASPAPRRSERRRLGGNTAKGRAD